MVMVYLCLSKCIQDDVWFELKLILIGNQLQHKSNHKTRTKGFATFVNFL